MATISLTMSRISSRAASRIELGELGQVDGVDERVEDRGLDVVILLGARAARSACAPLWRRLISAGGAAAGFGSGLDGGGGAETRACGLGAAGATGRGGGDAADVLRFPNMAYARVLVSLRRARIGASSRLALALLLGPVGQEVGEAAERIGRLRLVGHLLDHLAVIRRRAEQLGIEIDDNLGLELDRMAKILDRDLGTLGHADLVEHERAAPVVRARCLELIDQILGVAQIGEVGRGRDHHMVGPEHDLLGPGRPKMRHVDGDPRHVLAHHVEHGVAGGGIKIVGSVERAGSGEQAQMIGAARQQPVEQHLVETLGRGQRIGNSLQRILVEIEAGRAEGQVEIGDHHVALKHRGNGEGGVVADGARAGAALGPDKGNDLAYRPRLRIGVDRRNALDDLRDCDRGHDIFADAPPQELAIEQHVVDMTDGDRPWCRDRKPRRGDRALPA